VYVVAFDAQGCACPFPIPLWTTAALTETAGIVANRSPLRLLAVNADVVQALVLSDGTIGWLARGLVHESQENEFLKYLAPLATP
jgi:hypothetical protein